MKEVILLSCRDLSGFVHDDELLVRQLINDGFRVRCLAWEELGQMPGSLDGDIYIVRTAWNYTHFHKEFFEKLSLVENRLLNPLEIMKKNAHKSYLLDLGARGFNVIESHIVNNEKELKKVCSLLPGSRYILKPLIGASADGLILFDDQSCASQKITEPVLIQPFIEKIDKGEASLIFFNKEYSYSVLKVPKEGDIRVQEEHGGEILTYEPNHKELELANQLVDQIADECLYARVDLLDGKLMELELIEPALYFSTNKKSAAHFVRALKTYL